eukprot:CAMPEP_0113451700 /NCGR_PEP_ID=MMETSP0014_2-20120614/6472_1 /TAXON_ID=2857 /ORGANISM="Nitzschia sp." /LENGTH=457 /DNA_ID=CAMNT_0000343061 /DNA_START=205 /DNA_END=1578 /DNA_ORIENTATION=- /assembly_acc=CAM_ASM_000159
MMIKTSLFVLLVSSVSAFQAQQPTINGKVATYSSSSSSSSSLNVGYAPSSTSAIDVSEVAQRDVYTMQNWAQQYGVQLADGVEIGSSDGEDYSVMTNSFIPAGSPVMFVPADIIMSSGSVEAEYGGQLQAAEQTLMEFEGTAQRLPLFRLMIKVLAEYEKGQDSPWFPYLNAMPRRFYNGAAMTDACFDCLPPYAAYLAVNERNTYSRFVNALRKGYVPIGDHIINDDVACKWAYNVALTRFNEVWSPRREKKLAPMADMFNHNTYPNVDVTYDDNGNALATAVEDIQAGSPLTISLGDPSNPTPLFAKYGFLYNDCTTIFCKAMHLLPEIETLGYEFKDLLFETTTGNIAPKVWDIFLYKLLENADETGDMAAQFYVACKTNDEDTKQNFLNQYFPYVLDAVKNHVDNILQDIDILTNKAQSYNIQTHPRVPVIVAHNNLVKDTFLKVQQQLYNMG